MYEAYKGDYGTFKGKRNSPAVIEFIANGDFDSDKVFETVELTTNDTAKINNWKADYYPFDTLEVSYDFKDKNEPAAAAFRVGGDGKEIGLLAQEVEKVLPNIVLTDPDGNKLINYTAIIPIMIQSIKELKAEVEALKANK